MEQQNLIYTKNKAKSALKSSANWFYWIAGLSLINSLIILLGGGISFIVGLGVTQVIDQIAYIISEDAGKLINIFAFGLDVLFAGVFVLFGYLSNKGYKWSFIVGIVLYGMDGLIFLWLKDYLSIAFHGYAIYCIYRGINAIKVLKAVKEYEMQNGESAENLYEGKTETQINYLKQMKEAEDTEA